MTCACESVHPFPCQFPAETEFFGFDSRKWCRFHLPLQDAAGNKSDKGRGKNGWEEGGPELEKFTDEIHARLRAAASWDDVRINDTRANFNCVSFPSNFLFLPVANVFCAVFNKATFGNGVGFTGTTLGNNTEFVGATFVGLSYFTGTTFGNFCRINGATFGGLARFREARFGNWTTFADVKFGDGVIFTNASFSNDAHFDRATFDGPAHFDAAIFGNSVSFAKAKFQGSADFSAGTKMEANFDFKHIDFGDATFTGQCTFENRKFETSANFNGAVFHDLVEFHGCTFHPGMSFHLTKFRKTKENKLSTKKDNDDATERLERSYRTLKVEMEKLRARNEEADFFALEMECRRQRGSVPRLERFAATAYKHLSDYGRSIARPLVWMVFTLGYGFAYFYHLAQAKSFRAPGDILRFVMEQVVTPFSIWTSQYKFDPWMMKYQDEHPMLMLLRVPATLITLMAITLIALFLLALRRRFKMD